MRADRLLSLMLLLQARGKMTTLALAEELHVSRRTILRDIDALSFAGIPIYTDSGHGGGVALDENYRVKLNGLKEQEIHALVLSGNASLLDDIGLGDAAEQSLLKLLTALPSLHEQTAKHIRNRVFIDPKGWWTDYQNLDYLEALQTAVYENRITHIVYRKHDGTHSQRTIQPYGIIAKASVWYLVAKHDDQFRTYRVSRMESVTVTDDYFTRDDTFDLKAYWDTSIQNFKRDMKLYTCTLKVASSQENFLNWHVSGTMIKEKIDQEWLIVEIMVESQQIAEMIVFGLGAHVHILEPDSLREAIQQKSKQMLEAI